MKYLNTPIITIILPLFISWKLAILLVTFLGLSYLPTTNIERAVITDKTALNYWQQWANWDGEQYIAISEIGHVGYKVAFFPLLPLLIRIGNAFGIQPLWTGLALAHIFAFLATVYLYKLALFDFNEQISKKALIMLLAFPSSFFLGAVYTEPLFLFLTIASFYYARKQNWLIAALLAGLSGSARLVGIASIVAISIEYYVIHKEQIISYFTPTINRILIYTISIAIFLQITTKLYLKAFPDIIGGIVLVLKDISYIPVLISLFFYIGKVLLNYFKTKRLNAEPVLFVILILFPLSAYAMYLYTTVGNPLAFLNQSGWGREITFPWYPLVNYTQYFFDHGLELGITNKLLVEYIFALFLLVMLVVSYVKLRVSYTIYFAIILLMSFSSGTFLSIHRIALVLFPIYLILANIKNSEIFHMWLIFSMTLLGLFSVLFVGFYWIY